MKYVFLLLIFFCSLTTISGQRKNKDYSRILHSNNIYEIDAYLREAHPDDPKRSVLKPRLVKLLKDYIQTAHPADQRVKVYQEKIALLRRMPSTRIGFAEMNKTIKQKQIAKYKEELNEKQGAYTTKVYGSGTQNPNPTIPTKGYKSTDENSEEEEFQMLMSVNPIEHKNNTVKILNSLFDNDPNSKESIVMIENNSSCNMIMRIEGVGNTKYRLAIPAKGNNTIVVAKGDYLFSSILCSAQYASQKKVQQAIIVALGEPPKK